MGEGGGGEESSLPFSLPSFPFSPETPDTQAIHEEEEKSRTKYSRKRRYNLK